MTVLWHVSETTAAIEPSWLQRVRDSAVYAYRMPEEPFDVVLDDRFYISTTTVEAMERSELGDPLLRDAFAAVAATTLDDSGIRL